MKKFLSGLLIAGALLLASCSGVLDEIAQPESNGATGTVLVQIGSPAEARTLAPAASGIRAYIVKYAKSNGNNDIEELGSWESVTVNSSTQQTQFSLEPGTWLFKAIGYADTATTQAVASGSTSVGVEKGKVATAAILLTTEGDTNVPGTFSYEVDWAAIENSRVSSLTLNLTPHEDISGFDNHGAVSRDLLNGAWITGSGTGEDISTSTPLTHTNVGGTIALPSGVYDMDIELVVGGGASIDSETTYAHRTEVVYIYSYLETVAPKYTFTDLDIQKLHLTGPKPWLKLGSNHSTYIAQWMELYTEQGVNGKIIPFYTSNNGTTTSTRLSVTSVGLETGTWEIYIPGYAIASAFSSGTTQIAIKTEYSGIDDPLWVTVPIQTKQGSVYGHDDVDASGRIVKIVNGAPGAGSFGLALQNGLTTKGNPRWFNEAESVAGQGVVTPTVNVRTYTSSGGYYKVSYIEVEEMRDYGNGPEPYVYASTSFNPSINSYVINSSNNLNPDQADTPYPYRNTWNFAVPGMSGTNYTVPEADADITVTVHYFYAGDVVRGKHIGIFEANEETKYTIAYINRTGQSSSYEYGGLGNGLESIVVLDTPATTPTHTAQEAYDTLRSANGEGFKLPDITELAKVLYRIETDKFNASLVTTAPARYWSATQGLTVALSPGGQLLALVYKDNGIPVQRVTSVPSNLASISPSSDAYSVAVSGGWTGTYAQNPLDLIDSDVDLGYVQLVKTVNIP
jgi:hypothetical protein